ncbi:CDP-alcohol phosphatidyltransferase family protein [Pseudonocardia xishanensis]|uniref:CDP-alcohol phosphatidyltransferase family protein n=1 Tax=Pseudonocardia xishanensis TaxID=630995 RepID=A0ABP8RHR7_9PSEU
MTATRTGTLADRQQAGAGLLQLALLATLGAAVDLGPVGWLAGATFAIGLQLLLAGAVRTAGADALGPADIVTLGRAVLVGGVTALVADGLWTGSPAVSVLVPLATVALALDAVDGQVARRTQTVSELGARFDMETDAFLILVLSAAVAADLGPWVLVIGGLRYAYVAAGWVLPWLTGSLPVRYSAKAIAAGQGIVLVVAVSGLLPLLVAALLVAVALTALVWSFAQSVLLLAHRAQAR